MAKKKRYSGAEAVLQIEWSLEESEAIEAAYNAALNGVKEAAEIVRIEEQKLGWIFSGIRSRHIVGGANPRELLPGRNPPSGNGGWSREEEAW